jgi:ribosome biogenesis GTPase
MTDRTANFDPSRLARCDDVYRSLGLTRDVSFNVDADYELGRVTIVHGARVEVIACDGVGREVQLLCTFPSEINLRIVTGDWVVLKDDHVTRVLPRRSTLRRPDPNGKDVQILASNLDLVLLVVPIDRGLNIRMLERIAVMAFDSGARPVIILTKSDEADNAQELSVVAHVVVPGIEVLTTSSRSGVGIEPLRAQLSEGVTAVMLGPSGAGKTSLLNALEGRDELTLRVSRGGEGRHATSTRRLYRLASGGVLLDIPGIRLVDLLVGQDGVEEAFADIEALGAQCRFRDCSHLGDLGCAVQQAIDNGELSSQRYESWKILQSERSHQDRRRSAESLTSPERARKRTPKPPTP